MKVVVAHVVLLFNHVCFFIFLTGKTDVFICFIVNYAFSYCLLIESNSTFIFYDENKLIRFLISKKMVQTTFTLFCTILFICLVQQRVCTIRLFFFSPDISLRRQRICIFFVETFFGT